jgi:hypothetical protein
VVDPQDLLDFRQGPRDRELVGHQELGTIYRTTHERDAERLAESFDDIDGDALKSPFRGRRRDHLSVAYHQDTGTGPLRHPACPIQEHHLRAASFTAFDAAEAGDLIVRGGFHPRR